MHWFKPSETHKTHHRIAIEHIESVAIENSTEFAHRKLKPSGKKLPSVLSSFIT
jgi:hypothetical protein